MRFGIDLTIFGSFSDPALLLDLAIEAESAGWDGFFLWDHILTDGRTPVADPWMVLAAVAARTERIRFGPMVTPLARRRMSKLARETVTLDHLSGGRFNLGVGLGSRDEREFSAFGDPGDRVVRARVLDESLAVLSGLWSGEALSHEGEHLRADTAGFLPRPLQQPRIPVWVAALWPHGRPLRRAADWDGVFVIKAGAERTYQMSPDEMAAVIARVREHRTTVEPFDVVHAGLLSGDHAQDVELARRYADVGVTWWLDHIYPGRMTPDEVRRFIRGGPPAT
jgi:alkanesulfonate monooxygenase SsuD/methylene tetrahydromethanopterin reductase-like flavin-dependent oxidoreductase (luciferase family)